MSRPLASHEKTGPWPRLASRPGGTVNNGGHIERIRSLVEQQYKEKPTGCGGSFGEILCWEIHTNGLTFIWLAEKWGVSLPILGELIWDHCKRLEDEPLVDHQYPGRGR